jgi:integrase
LPSGRYQASYWHEGKRYVAPKTFGAKADADAWLANVRTDIGVGRWIDADAARERFDEYSHRWLENRHDLRPRTRELYESELKGHLVPAFGKLGLSSITTAKVRSWNGAMAQQTPVTAAKCYRLLRTILATAVEDGKLSVNPCTIKRAGLERSPERRIPTLEQVDVLAAQLPERYRALIYTATYAGLRFGECSALTRERVDLVHRTIAVTEQAQRVRGQGRIIGPPKSDAGTRVIAIPGALVDVLDDHLARFVGPEATALVFSGEQGAPLERSNWSSRFAKARRAAGVDGLRCHDLRHLAGTMAAQTGATTRELMARLGHSNPRAALIYQHATEERDHTIAAGLDVLIARAKPKPAVPEAPAVGRARRNASRTQRARQDLRGDGGRAQTHSDQGEKVERATGIEPA